MQAGARPTAPSPDPGSSRRHRDHRLEPRRPGRRVEGGLRLERLVSARPQVEVWKARAADGRSVALKLAPLEGPRAQARANALRHEFATLAALSHPGIVAAGDWIAEPDCVGFGLEYLDGGDLVSLAGLAPRHWLGPLAAVLDALRYLHGRGLVHRDVKARNVMLDVAGRARLIDFGSVAAVGSGWRTAGMTAEQRPEGYVGRVHDAGDDVYAFAALVFELMHGRPFHGPRAEGRPAGVRTARRQAARGPGEAPASADWPRSGGGAELEPLHALVAATLESSPEALTGSLEALSLVIESLAGPLRPATEKT